VQIQGEYSFHWDAYKSTMANIVERHIDGLSAPERNAVELYTILETYLPKEPYDVTNFTDALEILPWDLICENIVSISADYSNKNIREYLERNFND